MDDFSFGNVWGDDSSPTASPKDVKFPTSTSVVAPVQTPMDDFDSFNDTPLSTSADPIAEDTIGDDDEFGDFGDFGDAPVESTDLGGFDDEDGFGISSNAFASSSFAPPRSQRDWQPLRLQPLPTPEELSEQLDDLLEPIWDERLSDSVWSGEGIREVEGVGQILVTPER